MDFGGVGTLLSLLKGFYDKFTALGEDSKQLATDTDAIQKLAEDLKEFLLNNSDKFKVKHVVELQATLRECRTTIRKAEKLVEELSGTWKRLQQAVKDGHMAELQRKAKRCYGKLVQANQGILRALIVNMRTRPDQQPHSYTELYTACETGDARLVKTLLKNGADPWSRTETMKKTALHVAAFNAHTNALKAIKNHVKPQHTTAPSPEDELRKRSRLQRAQDNCEKWQDLAASMDKNWQMPLHYAAENGAVDAVELLVRALKRPRTANSFIDAQDSSGNSALHVAAENGRKEVVEALLRAGANPQLRNNEGQKPVALAENDDCAKLIKDKIESKGRKGTGEGERKEARDRIKKKDGTDEKGNDKKKKMKLEVDKRRPSVKVRKNSLKKRRSSSAKKRKKKE